MLMTSGRVLFALLFIFSGASKFFDIGSTAAIIEAKVGIPEFAAAYASQIEGSLGMTVFRLLAFTAASVEVICGLMIAFNLAPRFFAAILVLFVAVTTFYVHDFWNQSGGSERLENIVHVMKNISIIGALLMIIGYRSVSTVTPEPIYHDRVAL
ncbi:DoxX family protein [Bradyrhizobium sp. LHD-71]|uniref:DoxX family protein n=1 Tax=Bradyrhizobium sp. LHD-71 TaxID=3072141 RepID=UPI00280DE046|nr:DoxX family protein [Bradyrhizobium sp. LHD-71]MDQ8729908.1 DoxX family protein [Bradyrhizobium sp. LHD-71]